MNSSKRKIEPSYFAIIPANVRYDSRLCPSAKLLYGEITSLTNHLGFCYANNAYFAGIYNVSKQSINNWLKNLEEFQYIQRHIYRPKGSKEILNRYITIFEKPTKINLDRPIQEILSDNSKPLNNKTNNILKEKSSNNLNQNPNPRQ